MKYSLILSLVLSLIFQSTLYAQSANSCGMTTEEIDAINLSSGLTRLKLLSSSVTFLENPNMAKPLGDPANSDSVAMNTQAETLGAAESVANELSLNEQTTQMGARCNNEAALEEAKVNGTLQLYAQACIIYELVNRTTNMMAEIDALEKQLIEDKATQNKAAAENAKRENDIKDKKEKIEKTNKEITKAIKDIEKAKEELEKAKEAQEAAQKALDAANAITCGEDDDGSCASNKAQAIASAQKALDEAKKKVEKAEKKLNKAVAKLVDYLVDKMGLETVAVLSLLSGTIRGETDSGDVQFKVGSSDFTLIDLGSVISGLTGTSAEKAKQFTDGQTVYSQTDNYFKDMIEEFEKESRSYNGSLDVGDLTPFVIGGSDGKLAGNAKASIEERLEVFANLENGIDYLQTIALAVADYNEQVGSKQVSALESQKTPQSRMDNAAQKIEEKNAQKEKLTTMINKSLCYLDSSLTIYKGLYKETALTKSVTDPFYVYLNGFTTDKLKQKIKEGYSSTVDYKGIQKEIECYAKGGNEGSCKNTTNTSSDEGLSCHWYYAHSSNNYGQCSRSEAGKSKEHPEVMWVSCLCTPAPGMKCTLYKDPKGGNDYNIDTGESCQTEGFGGKNEHFESFMCKCK